MGVDVGAYVNVGARMSVGESLVAAAETVWDVTCGAKSWLL